MGQVKIIGDPGSCHMGKKEIALELIRAGAICGLDAIKFQIFKNLPPNIELPYKWIEGLVKYGEGLGVEVFASVWDEDGMSKLRQAGAKSVKFAYSQRNSPLIETALELFDNVYISGDVFTEFPKRAERLYCVPEYPVPYIPNFEDLFPNRFDGFSDHTLGNESALLAVKQGAVVIEKHFTLDRKDIDCPDHRFAIKPKQLGQMVEKIRRGS